MTRQLVIRIDAWGRIGEGKRTSNVGICGRLIEGRSRACSENTLRQSCLKGNWDWFDNVSELQAWVVCCASSDVIAEEFLESEFWGLSNKIDETVSKLPTTYLPLMVTRSWTAYMLLIRGTTLAHYSTSCRCATRLWTWGNDHPTQLCNNGGMMTLPYRIPKMVVSKDTVGVEEVSHLLDHLQGHVVNFNSLAFLEGHPCLQFLKSL